MDSFNNFIIIVFSKGIYFIKKANLNIELKIKHFHETAKKYVQVQCWICFICQLSFTCCSFR